RACDGVLSKKKAIKGAALSSLRNDPGLQQLLPHLVDFFFTKVCVCVCV
ncbi:unnamed protein product, partial [Discosporangium mesarthrocarpum]